MARNRNTPTLYGEWEFSEKDPLKREKMIEAIIYTVLYQLKL
jgi:hypothetical protein